MIKTRVETDKTKLNTWLHKNYPGLTMAHMQKLCRIGEIRVNGGRTKYNRPLTAGDEVKLPPYIAEYAMDRPTAHYNDGQKAAMLSSAIFEDDEIIAIDKPAGLASQGGSKVRVAADLLLNAAMPWLGGSARLVHRIDKETSGALLFAKTLDAARKYTALFKARGIKKTYIALVHGSTAQKEGEIRKPLPDEKGRLRTAVTHYRVLDEASGLLSMVELHPLTGRKHQLRLHMKHIGHPIAGDGKYASKEEAKRLEKALGACLPDNMCLHAWMIEPPGTKPIKAPLPPYFKTLMKYFDMDEPK
jgi:23S rRNA pseudouridine955/2504/2580 synthase